MPRGDYKINAPFPEIKIDGTNKYYARILLKNYAGKGFELSMALNYIYQKIIFKFSYGELSDVLDDFIEDKLHHIELFGELILKLDVDPKFRDYIFGRAEYFRTTPDFVGYEQDIQTILKKNIEREKNAMNTYLRQADMISDSNIGAVLRRIAQNNEHHAKVFKEILIQYFNK